MQPRTALILLASWLLLAPGTFGSEEAVPEAQDTRVADVRVSRLQGAASLGRNRKVVGAAVLISRSDEASRIFVTSSDVKGRFQVDGLPDGDYRIELRREGLHPVVKEDVELRFPSRAVIEVTMRPVEVATEAVLLPRADGALGRDHSVAVYGRLVERDEGEALPDVALRFVRTDGRADPIVVRTAGDGSFELPELPAGTWRLEARVVGFLAIWVGMDFVQDTQLAVTMVRQPAGYDPSPLELMPPEQPIPPERFLSPPPLRPLDDPEAASADEPSPDGAPAGPASTGDGAPAAS